MRVQLGTQLSLVPTGGGSRRCVAGPEGRGGREAARGQGEAGDRAAPRLRPHPRFQPRDHSLFTIPHRGIRKGGYYPQNHFIKHH